MLSETERSTPARADVELDTEVPFQPSNWLEDCLGGAEAVGGLGDGAVLHRFAKPLEAAPAAVVGEGWPEKRRQPIE